MKITKKIMLAVNILIIGTIFVLNYFYQKNGFDFTLKCTCSGAFALLGLINLAFALITKKDNKPFFATMSLGLILAMLGDVFINENFILGAGTFALGHILFVIAYCFIERLNLRDVIISAIIFIPSAAFLLLSPLLHFDVPLFKWVCLVYALIISFMLGKSVANFSKNRNFFTGLIAFASFLFFFSDLMLVFDWFIGLWSWTDHACMGTYYPALSFLALSMAVKVFKKSGAKG